MKRWRVDLAPLARREVRIHANRIADDSPASAIRFFAATRATAKGLERFPRAGSPCDDWHPDLAGIRRCAVKGFPRHLFFYEVEEDAVWIIRVLHGSQDLVAALLGEMH